MRAGSEVPPRPLRGRAAIEWIDGQRRARRTFEQPIVVRAPRAGRLDWIERIRGRPPGLIELPLAKAQAVAAR